MKRICPVLATVLLLGSFACKKEADKTVDPVICFFNPYLPVRILGESSRDLLSPAVLGTTSIKLDLFTNGQQYTVQQAVGKIGKDSFLLGIPLYAEGMQKLAIHFADITDTVIVQTSAASSQPYGLQQFRYNGKPYQLQPVAAGLMGIEVRKETSRK
ncbi:hypothetical protein [Sediminibacterium soli]|uniref:hypothetical protein n=1 Tax=Sediminibacterium soli TaxID=2698829 RepID=UPI00137B90CA|nr:hypothetical protein [Sediminibacterium soli]NCI47193.1 hypothetical protein [Sediminibacterium soli]